MATEYLTQKDLSTRLSISTRQIRNLHDEGIPREKNGRYPWPEARDWYIQFKQEEALWRAGHAEGADYEAARAEKMRAEAILRGLTVAERRGLLVRVDVVQEELATVAERIRQRLLGMADRWALQGVGLESEEAVRSFINEMVAETLEGLSSLGATLGHSERTNGKK